MTRIEIRPPGNEAEIWQLCRLNHAVFSEELRQHEIHDDGALVDKFHAKNLYFAGWVRGEAVGMICAHWQEPFSAVQHFGEVVRQALVPGKTAELRLFAIRPEYRKTLLAPRLGAAIFKHLDAMGFTTLIISGIAEQTKFYEHIGFRTIGAPILDGAIRLYPMVANLPAIMRHSARDVARCSE
ncbi:MAG: GNAT family N-acetyltransferase [Victivallales bacterium]|nr:GNAT family N-acetyltransferase [Victivallales bacterium]